MAKKNTSTKKKGNHHKKKLISNIPQKKEEKKLGDGIIEYEDGITVGELAEMIGQTPANVIKVLFMLGTMVTINSSLNDEQVELICLEYGYEVKKKVIVSEINFEDIEIIDDEADLVGRPPVVTIMGHVDHGKTTLLDYIRKSRVAEGEFGGITQHIGAYQVEVNGKKITFLDTPGHEAFTAMRARGAQLTDIVIIVVAADDGVMPQTKEAVDHALAAGVPIVVAINKIDKEGADPERIKGEMSELGLMPEEWGGDTVYCNISAKKGIGIQELLETLTVVAEVADLKANPKRYAYGSVVEGRLDKGRGPVATLLVQNGTLRAGDPIVVGTAFGRVRQMLGDHGKELKEDAPSLNSLYQLARFILLYEPLVAVVTYNYDKFLTMAVEVLYENKDKFFSDKEQDMLMENKRWKNGVRIEEVYGSFNNSQQADNILSIYHIHGYLPPFNEPFLSDGNEIVLSMEEYYDNVRNVYSWQTATQLHFLCHFTCIFVGISLSDINPQRMVHYASSIGNEDKIYFLHASTKNYLKETQAEDYKSYVQIMEIKDAFFTNYGLTPIFELGGYKELYNHIFNVLWDKE